MSDEKLLQEIGEIFGQYRTTDGQLVDFTKRAAEQMGVSSFDDPSVKSPSYTQPTFKNPFENGPLMTKFRMDRYYEWQKRVISTLERKEDVYVVAPPGGGKTMPLMGYWFVNLFLGGKSADISSLRPKEIYDQSSRAANPQLVRIWSNIFYALLNKKYISGAPIPGVLFITPIRVLSYEQAQGFQELLLDLLIFLKSLFMYLDENEYNKSKPFIDIIQDFRKSNNTLRQILSYVFEKDRDLFYKFVPSDNNQDSAEFDKLARNISYDFICVKTGGASEAEYSQRVENSPIIIATYGSAKNFINGIRNRVKFIVYDEAHLYQAYESDGPTKNEYTAASDAYKIIEAVCSSPASTQIAFLSGTINPASAQHLADYLNKKFGRHIHLVKTTPGDPSAVNKTQLRIIPDDSIQDDNVLVKMASRWITNGETGNAIILFSKKKINDLVKKIIAKVAPSNLNDINKRSKPNRYDEGKIRNYEKTLKLTFPNISPSELDQMMSDFKKSNFPSTQQDIIERIQNKPGADRIKNKKLREAIAYGVGYIYRKDDIDPTSNEPDDDQIINEDDKMIVAHLFSTGKINVLLATPSIGVGVNVSIKNMYLPTLEKFEGKKGGGFGGDLKVVNQREMSQLVNRAGRGRVPVSGIYVPSAYVSYMRDIISMGNEDHPEVNAIEVVDFDFNEPGPAIIRRLFKAISPSFLKSVYRDWDITTVSPGKLWNFFKDSLRRMISERRKEKTQTPIQSSKTVDEIIRKAENRVRNIDFELNSLRLVGNYSGGNGNKHLEKIKNCESKYNKYLSMFTDTMRLVDELVSAKKNIVNSAPQAITQRRQLITLVNVLLVCLSKIELDAIRLAFSTYVLYLHQITKLENDLTNNPNDWKLKQELQLLQNISRSGSSKDPWSFMKSKSTLRSKLEEMLKDNRKNINDCNKVTTSLLNSHSNEARITITSYLTLQRALVDAREDLNKLINATQNLSK